MAQLDTQFRRGNLSLQKLWYHLTPTMRSVKSLQDTVRAVKQAALGSKDARADIVGLLENRAIQCAGDPLARNLNLVLLRDCLPPLLEMLRAWIHQGVLTDDFIKPEFFVVELFKESSRSMLREAFADKIWERYDVASDRVPPMFEQVKEKILNTGKYWGVIRKCRDRDGKNIANIVDESSLPVPASTVPSEAMRAVGASNVLCEIESSYLQANRTLLHMLLNDYKLVAQLRYALQL
jgi:gamma-tubulin complex component 2